MQTLLLLMLVVGPSVALPSQSAALAGLSVQQDATGIEGAAESSAGGVRVAALTPAAASLRLFPSTADFEDSSKVH